MILDWHILQMRQASAAASFYKDTSPADHHPCSDRQHDKQQLTHAELHPAIATFDFPPLWQIIVFRPLLHEVNDTAQALTKRVHLTRVRTH